MNKTAIIPIIVGVVFIGGILAYLTTNISEEPNPPIKIAINEWPGYAHAFVAQEKGIFEKNGVAVELIFDIDYSTSQQRYIDGEIIVDSRATIGKLLANASSTSGFISR